MLRRVRSWLQRTLSTTVSPMTPPPTREQVQRTAAAARADRAGTITALHTEIRRLQQAIKDVSDALEGLTGGDRAAQEERLAALHRELEHEQRELDKLQARV
jgi:hypothetical protein